MKTAARLLCTLLCAALLSVCAFAYNKEQLEASKVLFDIGMMKGNGGEFSAEAMNLDGGTTRAELSVTITRLLGKEAKAKYQQNPHPFCDVPDWASDYVGYLYENYLVNGTSETTFGSDEPASVKQFATMLLRVLGYDDVGGDFAYDRAPAFAKSIGLLDESVPDESNLVRGDMMVVCLNALKTPLKRSLLTLSEKLYNERIFSSETLAMLGGGEDSALEDYFNAVTEKLCGISALRDIKGRVILIPERMLGEYGLRVFYTSANRPVPKQLPDYAEGLSGPSVMKGKTYYPDYSGAGYVKELTVFGLADEPDARLMIVSTSSEGDFYVTLAVSDAVSVPQTPVFGDLLTERYGKLPEKSYFSDLTVTNTKIKLTFENKVGEYGIHVFYTSADEVVPVEIMQSGTLPPRTAPVEIMQSGTTPPRTAPVEIMQSGAVSFTKGKPIYVSGDAATYIDELTINGLNDKRDVKLVVVFGSSEAALYEAYGRSEFVCVED